VLPNYGKFVWNEPSEVYEPGWKVKLSVPRATDGSSAPVVTAPSTDWSIGVMLTWTVPLPWAPRYVPVPPWIL